MRLLRYLIVSIVPFAASAHHGPGQFDASQQVEVTGAVTEVRFVNPHGYIYFDVTESDGTVTPWRCELQAGSLLRRAGWTEDLFPVGGTITVTGSPGRLEPHACALRTVILADGSDLNRYDQRRVLDSPTGGADRLVAGRLELSGTWAAPQRNPQGGAGGGGMAAGMGAPPAMGMGGGPALTLTDAGREAIEGLSHQEDNPRFHCMAVNVLFDWEFDRHVNEIIQTDDEITLKYGFMDIVRTISMDMDEHPGDIVPSRAGHSIGRWEDRRAGRRHDRIRGRVHRRRPGRARAAQRRPPCRGTLHLRRGDPGAHASLHGGGSPLLQPGHTPARIRSFPPTYPSSHMPAWS